MKKNEIQSGTDYCYCRTNVRGNLSALREHSVRRVRPTEYRKVEILKKARFGLGPDESDTTSRWVSTVLDPTTGKPRITPDPGPATKYSEEPRQSEPGEPFELALESRYFHMTWEDWLEVLEARRRSKERSDAKHKRVSQIKSGLIEALGRLGVTAKSDRSAWYQVELSIPDLDDAETFLGILQLFGRLTLTEVEELAESLAAAEDGTVVTPEKTEGKARRIFGSDITVTQRSDDFHACLKGHPEIWDCGKSPDEAIGKLLRTHPESFPVNVEIQES